jgi:hypothetical protein
MPNGTPDLILEALGKDMDNPDHAPAALGIHG